MRSENSSKLNDYRERLDMRLPDAKEREALQWIFDFVENMYAPAKDKKEAKDVEKDVETMILRLNDLFYKNCIENLDKKSADSNKG